MHARAEPPVSPTTVGAYPTPAPQLDQRRVVIRLRDGETILVGGAPSYERALVLAQKTITDLTVREGEWPMLRAALERWLAPANFDAEGRQRMALDRFRLPRG